MKKAVSLFLIILIAANMLLVFQSHAIGDFSNVISCGGGHSMLIKPDGSLWGCGPNSSGQLGDGTQIDRLTWVKIMDDIGFVSAGYQHTMAIKTDGSLWGWGFNNYGQIGIGEKYNESTANDYLHQTTPIKIMEDVKQVETDIYTTMAVKTDGSLWVWGEVSSYGIEGNMEYTRYEPWGGEYYTTSYQTVPKKIMDDVDFVSVGICAAVIKKDKSLWTWGVNNRHGTVGDGTLESRSTPVKIMDNVKYVSAADNRHTMAIKTDGSLWGWGSNDYGQIGDGTRTLGSITTPKKIMDNVLYVGTGASNTFALKTDGSLWGWGDGEFLGNDGKGNKYVGPGTYWQTVPLKLMSGVSAASVGSSYTLAVKTDGSLWGWGENRSGQLGNNGKGNVTVDNDFGDYSIQTVPLKIMNINEGISSKEVVKTKAVPTPSKIIVNGKDVAFGAYTINGYNYFKLRDLAMAINETEKQFEIVWDSATNSISLITNKAYTVAGGELSPLSSTSAKNVTATTSKVLIDGKEVKLTAYTIDGYNYFKLRDIAGIIDYGVFYDGKTSTITIDTSVPYTE